MEDAPQTPTPPAGWVTALNRFFHDEERPDALAAIRIALCAALLIGVVQRLPHARELISSEGAAAPLHPWVVPLVPNGSVAVAVYAVLAVSLAAGLVGWQTRAALAIATVLYPYVGMLDSLSTMTKYTVIGTHGLLLLAWAPSGAAWSVDARFGRGRPTIPRWPRRLIQLFLCVLYFGTAVTKIPLAAYHTGEHLTFWMLTEINAAHPLGHWLATHPTLAIVASELALLWELLFAALVWLRPVRRPMLAIGIGFHIGTFFLLGLWLFPLVMLALYPAFADPARVRRLLLRLTHAAGGLLPAPRWARPAASGSGFALAMAIASVTAVEAESRWDPLGQRDPGNRPAAQPLDASEARKLLVPSAPVDGREFVYRVVLGRTMTAGVMQPLRGDVRPGEPLTLQLWVHDPHPDWFLQADLARVREGRATTLHEGGTSVLREVRSPTLAITAPTEPGRYAVLLKSGGEEFDRVSFTVR